MSCDPVLAAAPASGMPEESGRESAHAQLAPVPESAGVGRRFVRDLTADLLDEDGRDAAMLLTSELITNAVIHARTPLEVGVAWWAEAVLVAVGDRNQIRPEQQPYDPDRTSGRGLTLVGALADDWGVATFQGGKTAWFLLRRPG